MSSDVVRWVNANARQDAPINNAMNAGIRSVLGSCCIKSILKMIIHDQLIKIRPTIDRIKLSGSIEVSFSILVIN